MAKKLDTFWILTIVLFSLIILGGVFAGVGFGLGITWLGCMIVPCWTGAIIINIISNKYR